MNSIKLTILSIIFLLYCFLNSSNAQWVEQTSGITTGLNSVNAVDNNVVWTCGASGKILLTTNGGTTWTSVTSPNASLTLYCIWGISADTAVVSGSTTSAFVYKTVNGGSTWTQTFTQTGGFIDAIEGGYGPTQHIYIEGDPVGGRWSLWSSYDGGSSWDSLGSHVPYIPQSGSEAGWNNSAAIGAGGVFIGTSNTRVYYSDSNNTVSTRTTTGLVNSLAIWVNHNATPNTVMTGGTILLYSTDTGINWTTLTAPGSGNILGITGSGNYWCYVRGASVYSSTNNGSSWSNDYTASSGNFNHISMSRSGTSMWAIRDNGGIARSLGPIGIIPISTEVPNRYSLHQNYPNPFNPDTKLKFAIPKSSFSTIRIYDVLGREVKTLVNQALIAGIYETTWDATNYPSGVYYYRLVSGNYTETKKMVLLK